MSIFPARFRTTNTISFKRKTDLRAPIDALLVGLLLAVSWGVCYVFGGAGRVAPHWFYVPIFFATRRFGHVGSGITAAAAALLAGPLMPADVAAGIPQARSDYLSRGVSFVLIGQLMAFTLSGRWRAERGRSVAEDETRAMKTRLDPYDRAERKGEVDREQIQRIISEHTMRMEFQPIVDLESGRIISVEGLARFPVEPVQPPDVWFSQAWEAGLGAELEVEALRLALMHIELLPEDLPLAVNLSPRALTTDACADVLAGADCTRLIAEITEHRPVEQYDLLLKSLNRFRTAGGRIAVDDLGAGFASLRHMLLLFPDIVKLDVSFIRGIDHDPGRRTLAAALTQSAGKLNASVVAEGIETPGELEVVRLIGVQEGQGYYLGRPVPITDLRFEDLHLSA
jgi:EAL domain-containing protein (putative c-di-GMP-specific phosphodiesterase class I)